MDIRCPPNTFARLPNSQRLASHLQEPTIKKSELMPYYLVLRWISNNKKDYCTSIHHCMKGRDC